MAEDWPEYRCSPDLRCEVCRSKSWPDGPPHYAEQDEPRDPDPGPSVDIADYLTERGIPVRPGGADLLDTRAARAALAHREETDRG